MKVNKSLNHTAAHILAAAVLKLYPDTQIGFGPAIEEGFYYDFKFTKPLHENDLAKIEKQMKKIASGNYQVKEVADYDASKQVYKQELINEFKAQKRHITYYGLVNKTTNKSIFTDLCAGDHVKSTAKVKHFKLLSLAGAYWRGDSNNEQLTRIYGTCWETKDELDAYLTLLQERKERDHRKIGKEMNLFTFNLLAGQGFPIWLENGMIIKNTLQAYIRQTEAKYGFKEVQTPSLGALELYQISGHWQHYQEDMFKPVIADNEKLVLRPMTCPHHVLLYKIKRHSYRDLPVRMSEQARLFRYEKSGALTGLERVRAMELTEGHVFARIDQIEAEFKNSYNLILEVLTKLDIEIDYISLSLRDPEDKEKYFDDDAMWNQAENALKQVLQKLKINYREEIGEAAFYGPKMDIQVKSILGHEITVSTLQLDFLLPQKFDISYINKNEQKERPVLIHRGLIGTYERFLAILLEQTKGNLPFWLAPSQITIIPVNIDKHLAYSQKIAKQLTNLGYRVYLDERNERVGKKIREAQMSKTKWQIVLGDEEKAKQTINIRAYGSQKQEAVTLEHFIKTLNNNK